MLSPKLWKSCARYFIGWTWTFYNFLALANIYYQMIRFQSMNDLVCDLLSFHTKAATWNEFFLTFDIVPGLSWKSKQCNQKTLKQCREGGLCFISSFQHPFTGLLFDLLPRVSDSKYQIMSVSLPLSPLPRDLYEFDKINLLLSVRISRWYRQYLYIIPPVILLW